MSESPESFEEWKARTSPGPSPQAVTRDRRLLAGVFGVLGLLCFWVDEPGAKALAVGLLVLAAENVVHLSLIRRGPDAGRASVAVRGVALGVTLVLALVAAVTSTVLAALVAVVLVGMDLVDDPSFLRTVLSRFRQRT